MPETPHRSEERFAALLPVLLGETQPAEMIGLDQSDLVRIAQLGIASFAAAQYPRAQRVFAALARLQPDLYLAHQYLGMIAEHTGELESAARHYSNACTRIDPANETLAPVLDDTLFLLAGVLLRLSRPKEAADVLGALLEHSSRLGERMRRQVLAMMAKIEEVVS